MPRTYVPLLIFVLPPARNPPLNRFSSCFLHFWFDILVLNLNLPSVFSLVFLQGLAWDIESDVHSSIGRE